MPTRVWQEVQFAVKILFSSNCKYAPKQIQNWFTKIQSEYVACYPDQLYKLTTVQHNQTKLPFSFLPATAERVVAIGDLHGDFISLLNILTMLDNMEFFENPNNYVVFLGDYIDRGRRQLETFLGVLYLRNKYPANVILLRGNHEDVNQPQFRRGFWAKLKEQGFDDRFFSEIGKYFKLLPIYALTHTGILFVHGGPYFSLCPPKNVIDLLANVNTQMVVGGQTLVPALWVDPYSVYDVFSMSSLRFSSLQPQQKYPCNLQSLLQLNIRRVIRGHQAKTLVAQKSTQRIITVFSTGAGSADSYYDYVPKPYIADINIPADDIRFYPIL